MSEFPNCPKCNCEYTYENMGLFVCPECAYEFTKESLVQEEDKQEVVKDASGNILNSGDNITVIKDLKVKGTTLVVKVGTKVKNIRIVGGDHGIDCKIDGIGAMKLKSEFVRKA